MSTNTLNGVVGQAARFASDFLFKETALPNAETIYSTEHTLNNTLGRLKIVGSIDAPLTIAASGHVTVILQNKKEDGGWEKYADVLSATSQTLSTGEIFAMIPTPHETKRVFRLALTTDFNASAVKVTSAVEALPLA